MSETNDPRVYFAAERTLLAWVRSGIAVIGLGFVVARFGLFLRMLRTGQPAAAHAGSTWIGVALVALGSMAMILAAWQHYRYCRTLPAGGLPRSYLLHWPIWFAAALSVIGAALAVYLVNTAPTA